MNAIRHPMNIDTHEKFDATEFELGVIYTDNGRGGLCEVIMTEKGWRRRLVGTGGEWRSVTDGEVAQYLPLNLSSEPTPEPVPTPEPAAPEFTDEQRAAVEWLRTMTDHGHVGALLAVLPAGLTTPPLPTEPGTTIYGGRDQPRTMFRLAFGNGPRYWIDDHGDRHTDDEARDLMGEWEAVPDLDGEQVWLEGYEAGLHDAANGSTPNGNSIDPTPNPYRKEATS